MPAKYVRSYSRGQKNDFCDAEAVQRPTMKFVATKTAEQLDLQAFHRVRERLVSQRTGIINQIGDRSLLRELRNAARASGLRWSSRATRFGRRATDRRRSSFPEADVVSFMALLSFVESPSRH
jgi:transposase